MTRPRAAWLAALVALSLAAGRVEAQSSVHIARLTVSDLSPLTVEFDVEGAVASHTGVRGQITLSESEGAPIDRFDVATFAIPAGGGAHVRAESRWEFELAGTYLVEATIDLGAGALVSASLPFRIAPIALPRVPVPTDPAMLTLVQEPANWGLDRIGTRDAWSVSHGSNDVVVAVIDSGIDSSIPQLRDSLWVNEDEVPGNGLDDDHNGYIDDLHGWDFRDGDASSLTGSALHGHGTGVASIIAARPGRYPVVGVAPGVRLMDVRFLDSANSFRSSDWKTFVRAVDYAVDNGAHLINLSIYANAKPPASFEQAIVRARERGVIVVGIAGNQGDAELMYPGRYEAVLSVSSLSAPDRLSTFSNRGPSLDLCAPGDAVATFTVGGRVVLQSGTSFAAPHVTGVLALVLSAAPRLDAARAVELLESSALDLGPRGWDAEFGHGLVDAASAVLAALGP